MQVKHIDHVDDLVFDGHAIQAIDTLAEMVDVMRGAKHAKHLFVSTKFDGSPAIVFGTNPENDKFFVGTKSVFNKRIPKIIYKQSDITVLYNDKKELGEKLYKVWDSLYYLYNLGMLPNGVFQADLMYTADTALEDAGMVHFTPNTITYGVPAGGKIADRIRKSDIGLAVHTQYHGETMKEMTPLKNVYHDQFSSEHGVFFINPEVEIDGIELSADSTKDCVELLLASDTLAKIISGSSILKAHNETIKKFMNHCIRIGENNPSPRMYEVFLINRGFDILAQDWKHADISIALAVRYYLDFVKRILMEAMDVASDFYHEIQGEPTTGEGYVVRYHGVLVKLVNRIEFSRRNFENNRYTKVN